MNNTQVAQAFAKGEIKGKSSNVFIDGDTIYSYGWHFPIARLIGPYYALFNSNGYSNSTAKHKGHVLSALHEQNKIIIECPQCDLSQAEDYLREQITEAKAKKTRARSEGMKYVWDQRIQINTVMLDNLYKLQHKEIKKEVNYIKM